MARYCALNPVPPMLPSERKLTHTVLLLVLTVGGATFPQNLGSSDPRMTFTTHRDYVG